MRWAGWHTAEIAFEQIPQPSEVVSYRAVWRGRASCQCQCPEAGGSLAGGRDSRKTSVARGRREVTMGKRSDRVEGRKESEDTGLVRSLTRVRT